MKLGFYPRLAASGLRKNRRLFVPYLLTCTGMTAMFYILLFLALSDTLQGLTGAVTIQSIFSLGSQIIALFAAIFLFYTHSFLMRRRKKEFGLYHVLGMGKRNLSLILLWETLITAALSLGLGLLLGIAFSKLAELGLIYVIRGEVSYRLSLPGVAVRRTVTVFLFIFALLLLNSIRQVRFSTALSLLRSENTGEKPPRGNWFLGLLGVIFLVRAYLLALLTKEPLAALGAFFGAVVLVILGTYLVMISLSVTLCRLLQKRKDYYYKPSHFVSVASMAYRMKRNGAGLASICVLATMVLVTVATCGCLYFGEESAIRQRYPRQIDIELHLGGPGDLSEDKNRALKEGIDSLLAGWGCRPENGYCLGYAACSGVLEGERVSLNRELFSADMASRCLFFFVPLADYNAQTGAGETLDEGEALLYCPRYRYEGESLTFENGPSLRIRKQLDCFPEMGDTSLNLISSMILVVPDVPAALGELADLADFSGDRLVSFTWLYNFDTGLDASGQVALYRQLQNTLTDPAQKQNLGYGTCTLSSRAHEWENFTGLYGSLFYLGILLSAVFLLAAVLIIYYKQVSEGYEDQARFAIMQKVGMTRREIKRSIRSQLLTVFYMPLALAALHLVFAFPIIRRLLLMFSVDNGSLFAAATGISLALFALLYTAVYVLTSNVYYHIVSGAREEAP